MNKFDYPQWLVNYKTTNPNHEGFKGRYPVFASTALTKEEAKIKAVAELTKHFKECDNTQELIFSVTQVKRPKYNPFN